VQIYGALFLPFEKKLSRNFDIISQNFEIVITSQNFEIFISKL